MKHSLLLAALLPFLAMAQVNHWETVVYEDDVWKYDLPSAPVDPLWNTVTYNDAFWNSGMGGFGYGDGDDNTVIPSGTISCYQRVVFSIVDVGKIDQAIFNIDYDDDFVAYLNGVEIGRGTITGTPPAYNQTAGGLHEAQMYAGGSPEQFVLDNVTITGLLTNGNNVLCVQTHNENGASSDFSSRVWLHLGINDSSNDYGPTPAWFSPPLLTFTDSDLPIVVINTFGVAIPDEPKIYGQMGIINNGPGMRNYLTDPYNEYDGEIGIEQRGSSSAMFPKEQYGIETRDGTGLNLDTALFGMPSENDWVLYAPYSDKTLMRNVLTYELGRAMGHWAPRTQFCEVVLNGEYIGVYVFMEKIKRDAGRVDIAKLNYIDTLGDELTGGYIVKIDKSTGGGIIEWSSPYAPYSGAWQTIGYQMHYPESADLHPTQLNYIETIVTDFETALDGPNFTDPVLGYAPYINEQSFYDYFISNELSKNVDGYRLSSFLCKEKDSDGGKLVAGPLWDFNLAWGNANYCSGSTTTGWELDFYTICGGDSWQNPFWWDKLLRQDTAFANNVNCRWQQLRMGPLHTDSLMDWIDSTVLYLNESQQRNFLKWPIHGVYVWPNNFVGNTYQEDVDYMKQWIMDRITWLDANMFGNCWNLGLDEETAGMEVLVFPNPAADKIYFDFERQPHMATLLIYDSFGKLVYEQKEITNKRIPIQIDELSAGLYFYQLNEGMSKVTEGKIMVQ